MRSWFKVKARAEGDDAAVAADISIYDDSGMWGVTAKDFIAALNQIDAKTIVVSINSPGGSVFDALAIYNALRLHDAEIVVRVMGVAASAASLIAMAGDAIEMPENTFMMIHNPLTFAYGNAAELRDMADVLDKIGASLASTYEKRSGQPRAELEAMLATDTWLTATEAHEKGFATKLLPSLAVEAAFEVERLPENVRAAFEAGRKPPTTPAAPSATRGAAILAAASAAGFERFADVWALDQSVQPGERLDRVVVEAHEITDLCSTAGFKDEADALIAARKSMADVFAHLTDLRAVEDEARHIDSAPKPKELNNRGGAQAVTTRSMWAKRTQQLSQRGI